MQVQTHFQIVRDLDEYEGVMSRINDFLTYVAIVKDIRETVDPFKKMLKAFDYLPFLTTYGGMDLIGRLFMNVSKRLRYVVEVLKKIYRRIGCDFATISSNEVYYLSKDNVIYAYLPLFRDEIRFYVYIKGHGLYKAKVSTHDNPDSVAESIIDLIEAPEII